MSTQTSVLERLNHGLQKVVREKEWKTGLSEIQLKAIPIILEGVDCIIEAPTAGGKTEAVLFPTLTRASFDKKDSVQILYIAPLRALLNNIEKRAEEYAAACGLHCFKWHGDVDQKEKIKEFNNPSQLLLTTPESLEAILLRKAGWTKFFSDLEVVIIDEAHNFAAGDRGGHLSALLERLEKAIDIPFQRIALTATVGNPAVMLKWLAGSKREPGKRVHASSQKRKKKDYLIRLFDKALDNGVEEKSHIRQFKELYTLLPNRKSIVFGRSRKKTEELAAAVRKMNDLFGIKIPVRVRTHHSSVSKFYREEAERLIQAASESGLQAIMSTSTLELGIDIGELDLVIQVGTLVSSSAFLQRVGRTGRREGKKQFFRGLCTSRKDLLLLTAVVNLGLKSISESIHISKKAFHLLAHQLICLSLQDHGIKPMHAWDILSDAYCFSNISVQQFHELVQAMIQKKYLRDVDGELVVGEASEKAFLGSNWRRLFATFDSAPMYDVMEGKNQVGTLDSSFVESISVPFLFVLGGIEWKAEKVNTKMRQVMATRTKIGDAPSWFVTGVGNVPRETAKEVGNILFGKDIPDFLDGEAREGLISEKNNHRSMRWTNKKWVIIVSESGKAKIWTFAGDRINLTLALIVEEEKIGVARSSYDNVEIESDIEKSGKLLSSIEQLLEIIKNMVESQLENLEKKIARSMRRAVFSKFSRCLSDSLWSDAIAERALDIRGLKEELGISQLGFIGIKEGKKGENHFLSEP
jgi:ATP-dependent Lhr-like helicase